MRSARHIGSWVAFGACGVAVALVDLVTKAVAVHDPSFFGHGLIHNPDVPSHASRLLVCVATIAVVAAASHLSARHGHGRLPVLWVAAGLLVGGVAGNWSASVIWRAGVPDFIARGDRMWNLADFAIGLGMLLALVSSVGYAVRAWLRGRVSASP